MQCCHSFRRASSRVAVHLGPSAIGRATQLHLSPVALADGRLLCSGIDNATTASNHDR